MKIANRDDAVEVGAIYIPATIMDACPSCGEMCAHDPGEDLSYIKANVARDATMTHEECPKATGRHGETSWKVKVVLRVTLEAA